MEEHSWILKKPVDKVQQLFQINQVDCIYESVKSVANYCADYLSLEM